MGRHEDIDNAIWGDPEFRALSADAKLAYLWTFTNPLCNMAGLYKVDEDLMVLQTRLTPSRLARAREELVETDFLRVDPPWIWNRSRVKYLRSRGPSMARSIAKDIESILGSTDLAAQFLSRYGDLAWLRDALSPLVSGKGAAKPKSDTLSGGCTDPRQRVHGNGNGLSVKASKNSQRSAARELERRAGGRRVTKPEWSLTAQIVEAFNEAAGSAFTAEAHFRPIVGRVREHPEVDLEGHRRIITAAFERPWWTDRPAPNVVYGNAAQFERSIEQARHAEPSTADFLAGLSRSK